MEDKLKVKSRRSFVIIQTWNKMLKATCHFNHIKLDIMFLTHVQSPIKGSIDFLRIMCGTVVPL